MRFKRKNLAEQRRVYCDPADRSLCLHRCKQREIYRKEKAEETYRKINLEAAKEISRQLRLRNLSGIILIDFINMTNPDHNNELFHVLQKYLRKDPVKCKAIDITPLHILEMTRKKVRKPVIEEIRQIKSGDFSNTL